MDGASVEWSEEAQVFVARILVQKRLCTSHGATREEALDNLRIAAEAMKDVLTALALLES